MISHGDLGRVVFRLFHDSSGSLSCRDLKRNFGSFWSASGKGKRIFAHLFLASGIGTWQKIE